MTFGTLTRRFADAGMDEIGEDGLTLGYHTPPWGVPRGGRARVVEAAYRAMWTKWIGERA